jgi:CHASE2 domain-containing sensor protein/tRNA A-37 threonylcarbamoyl transferase component Bud32
MTKRNPRLDLVVVLIIILAFISLSFLNTPLFNELESRLYEAGTFFMGTDERNADKIILIDIDEKSMKEFGPWPWPRKIIADMIKQLSDSGVKVIGLNLPFYKRDNNTGLKEINSFHEKYRIYPPTDKDPDLKKWVLDNLTEIEKRLNNDKILIDSLKQAKNVILPVGVSTSKSVSVIDKTGMSYISKNFLKSAGLSPYLHEDLSIKNLLLPYQELMINAAGLGHVNLKIDKTMAQKSQPIFLSYMGSLLPSLPLRLAISFYDQKPNQVSVENDRIIINGESLPLVKGRLLTFNKEARDMFPRYSFADILKNKKSQSVLTGKIIVIGLKRPIADFNYSPITDNTYDPLLIAGVLRDIINKRVASRPFYVFYVELLTLILLNLVLLSFFDLRGQSFRFIGTIFILVITFTMSVLFLLLMQIWFKSVYIICAIITVYIYLSIRALTSSSGIGKESRETTRLLGLNFQSQGLFDLAFDKFKKLPLDKETKDLIYNLGLEYQKKGLISKALTAFNYINKDGGFRDVDDRILALEASDQSSTLGSYDIAKDAAIVSDSESGAPTTVGRYKIIGELGKGSMGLVYKAQDPKINRLVAIKTIRFSDEFDEDVIHDIKERFFREAEIAGKLSHPSIVTIHDVGDDRDLTYMAMEYLEGEDLDNFIKRRKLPPIRRVLDIVREIAEALNFAHNMDVIHRDVKPANVMLLQNGHVKVTDFGIAKAISSSRTKTGVILGTPNYMSPEQIMGQKINSKSDIFSLGVLFYQLLTGELPFHGDNLSGLLYQITQVKHPSPRSYNPKIPKVCEQILEKALAKDPNKRFKSAGDMAHIISALSKKIDQIRMKKAL